LRSFSTFRKRFDAGPVSLKPWSGGTNSSMYLVIVQ